MILFVVFMIVLAAAAGALLVYELWFRWRPPGSITCPRCGRTSYNENDVREGYCGACYDWTAEQNARPLGNVTVLRRGGR